MASHYSIQVSNQSGAEQKYVIFSEPPKVTGSVQGKIWSNVLDSAETPVGQTAAFAISKQYYAVCGHSHGTPADGISMNVKGVTPVTLGTVRDDGTLVPGTTLSLKVAQEAPYFDPNQPAPSGYRGAFEIDTAPDFTMADAIENNFMIGVGGEAVPAALFMPQPNVRYQIQPVNKYWIGYGDYAQGALIDTAMVGQAVAVDFTRVGPSVKISHTENGTLVLQTS